MKPRAWSDAAFEAVKRGNISINIAAKVFGVSYTTLQDLVSGIIVHVSNPGPGSYLDDE